MTIISEQRKVFSVFGGSKEDRWPDEAKEACIKLNGECYGHGNGGYFDFEIVKNPTGDEQGYGYVDDASIQILTQWLVKHGAVFGEEVLIHVSW